MPNKPILLVALAAAGVRAAVAGCGGPARPQAQDAPATGSSLPAGGVADEVAAERAKLAPANRALVEAQEWCVVNTDERLGSMGPPVKLDVKGQPVFLCCKGCKRRAEADPDETLAKVEGLKAKAKAEKGATD